MDSSWTTGEGFGFELENRRRVWIRAGEQEELDNEITAGRLRKVLTLNGKRRILASRQPMGGMERIFTADKEQEEKGLTTDQPQDWEGFR